MSQIEKPYPPSTILCALLGLVALLTTSGCATSMTYSTFPQTLDPGEVSAGVSAQTSVNTAAIRKGVNTLRIAEYHQNNSEDLTEAEYRELLDTLIAFALFRPSVVAEGALRAGVWEGIDVGLRYNTGTVKGDVKVRVWQSDDEKSVFSVSAGVGHGSSMGPEDLKYITWQEFSRLDAEIAMMYGYDHSDFFRTYIGPRMMQSWVTVEPLISPELEEQIPEEYQQYRPDRLFRDENILYLGGTAGLMLGYKWIWLHLEATVMYTLFSPMVIDKVRDLSGFTIVPVVGLSVEF